MSDIKLKPCPFCGSECVNDTTPPEFNDVMGFYWVCPDCVSCGPASDTVYLATTSWNGRNDDTLTAKVAELKQALCDIRSVATDVQDGFNLSESDNEIVNIIDCALKES